MFVYGDRLQTLPDSSSRLKIFTNPELPPALHRLGGVGFETSSARWGRGAVLVANSTRPVIDGVSVLLLGNQLGLHFKQAG